MYTQEEQKHVEQWEREGLLNLKACISSTTLVAVSPTRCMAVDLNSAPLNGWQRLTSLNHREYCCYSRWDAAAALVLALPPVHLISRYLVLAYS